MEASLNRFKILSVLLLMSVVTIIVLNNITFSMKTSSAKVIPISKLTQQAITRSMIHKSMVLGRGEPAVSPNIKRILKGTIKPHGGNATQVDHQHGNTNSNYSSWVEVSSLNTEKLKIILGYATHDPFDGTPCNGVIMVRKVNPSENNMYDVEKFPLGDVFGEYEILVEGILRGCFVIHVTPQTTVFELRNKLLVYTNLM